MELKASTVTPRQAALILGIRLDSVYGLIWAGRLAAEKCDGRWLVDRAAVDARVRDRAMRRSLTHKELPARRSSAYFTHDADLSTRHSVAGEEA
jgi:excisionase family DNA binding protein